MIELLGTTHNPRTLIPGIPSAVFAQADAYKATANDLADLAWRAANPELGEWEGLAADGFRERVLDVAVRVLQASDAVDQAADRLQAYGHALEYAQRRAQHAIDAWDRGVAAERAAPGTGAELVHQQRAYDILSDAARDVSEPGTYAARQLHGLAELTPYRPTFWNEAGYQVSELGAGAGEAFAGLGSLLRGVVDIPHRLTLQKQTAEGLATAVTDPIGFRMQTIDAETWLTSPARALGHLAPDAAMAVLTSGTGLAALRAARIGAAIRVGDDLAEGAAAIGRGAGAVSPTAARAIPAELAGLRVRDVTSGQRGAWASDLYRPEPNTVYRVDDWHLFVTDDWGRVTQVESELAYRPGDVADLHRNTYQQSIAGGEYRLETDQGGHLVAASLGGPGEPINLIPMDAALNRQGLGSWGSMESEWLGILRNDPSAQISVKIDVEYPPGSTRPNNFEVRYSVNGGNPQVRGFDQ